MIAFLDSKFSGIKLPFSPFLPFQRYRYSEAYQVDQILQNMEQEFISKNSVREEVLYRMKSVSSWRTGLIVSGLASFLIFYKKIFCNATCKSSLFESMVIINLSMRW